MRPPALVRAVLATLALSAAPALAQEVPPALSRTLTVQQLEAHVLSLYPSHALGPWQAPTLTLTAEDGARYPFTLVMDGAVDVKVRVQRGECPPPESPEAAVTRLLLRQPVERLRQVAYQRLGQNARLEDAFLQVEGTLPLAPHALLILKLEGGAETFVPGEVLLSAPEGPLRVLGQGTPDVEGRFSVIVERPEGQPDGLIYTLTLPDNEGARRLVAPRVTPWPLAPPSPQGDILGPQQSPEGSPGGTRHRKVPGAQRLHPR